jgi:hypothetical protein
MTMLLTAALDGVPAVLQSDVGTASVQFKLYQPHAEPLQSDVGTALQLNE